MHSHKGLQVRSYLVTLMSANLPVPRVHQLWVDTPCTCDLREYVEGLKDLPFPPAFMVVQRRERVIKSKSRT